MCCGVPRCGRSSPVNDVRQHKSVDWYVDLEQMARTYGRTRKLTLQASKRRRRELYGGYRSRSRPDFISVPCCRFSILSRWSGTRYIRVSTVSCLQHVSGYGSHADVRDWFGTSSNLATGSSKPRRSSVTYVNSAHNEVFENVASRAIRSSTLRVTYSFIAPVPSNNMMSTEARLC